MGSGLYLDTSAVAYIKVLCMICFHLVFYIFFWIKKCIALLNCIFTCIFIFFTSCFNRFFMSKLAVSYFLTEQRKTEAPTEEAFGKNNHLEVFSSLTKAQNLVWSSSTLSNLFHLISLLVWAVCDVFNKHVNSMNFLLNLKVTKCIFLFELTFQVVHILF